MYTYIYLLKAKNTNKSRNKNLTKENHILVHEIFSGWVSEVKRSATTRIKYKLLKKRGLERQISYIQKSRLILFLHGNSDLFRLYPHHKDRWINKYRNNDCRTLRHTDTHPYTRRNEVMWWVSLKRITVLTVRCRVLVCSNESELTLKGKGVPMYVVTR